MMPALKVVGKMLAGASSLAARPRTGKRTKVEARITRCRRQWVIPAITASRDSLAPCRKNSSAMTSLVTSARPSAA